MDYEILVNEPVKVWVFFNNGIFPIAMNWRRRFVKFQKLILVTTKRVGQVKIMNLICVSDTSNFELEYNSDNQIWKLTRVMPKE